MSDNTVYVVTDDAAMLSGDPRRMHPTDLMILAGKTAISSEDALREMEKAPLDTAPYHHEEVREVPPDCVPLPPGGLRRMAELADDKMKDFLFVAHGVMSPRRAQEIRMLRVGRGQSWRAVASEMYEVCETLPGFAQTMRRAWWPPANQLMGMALCEVAAKELGEDYLAAPWN